MVGERGGGSWEGKERKRRGWVKEVRERWSGMGRMVSEVRVCVRQL